MKLNRSLVAVALGALALTDASAGFYVADDLPAPALIRMDATRKDKTVYASFVGARLDGGSRADIEEAVDATRQLDSIVITTFARTKKQLDLANKRVAAVKIALARKGVPLTKIIGSAELDPKADELDSDIQLTFRHQVQRQSTEPSQSSRVIAAPVQQPVAPLPVAVLAAPTAPPQSTAKLDFVKKIMSMAGNKLISQDSAIKLVNEYLSNMAPVMGQTPAVEASPVMPAAPQIVPFGEVPRIWTLAANKSLRDNIRDWSLTAGYSEPVWNASNPYQITYSSTYTGSFLEVLNQVAVAVPSIDFRVSRNSRRVDVVDHQ